MDYLDYFGAYLGATLTLAFIGYCFFSELPKVSEGKLSKLETITISLGIGILFIIVYGFILDLFVHFTGLIPNTQFLLFVGIPVLISLCFKVIKVKIKLKGGMSVWKYFVGNYKKVQGEIRGDFSRKYEELKLGKYRHQIALYGIFGIF